VRDLDHLAALARDGDHQALERLLRAVQPDVWRFAAHLTHPDHADDLTQDALLRVITHLDRWHRGSVLTWVIGITRNVCHEHIRRRDRRRTIPVRSVPEVTGPDLYAAVDVADLVAQLPIDQREAFVLTQVIGFSYAEAAEIARCPIGTIRSRIARARDALNPREVADPTFGRLGR
jgi:RNA polymerase sigma-70 factor, ECF subfamily